MNNKAKYRIREGRVSTPRGGVQRAFIAEKLISVFGIPLFYWPCTNAGWRLSRQRAMEDIGDDLALCAPLSRPTAVYYVTNDVEVMAASDETFADLPDEIHITVEEIAAFSQRYASLEPSPVSEAQLPDDVHITGQDYDMFARAYAAEQRLPYPLRLEIGKALDRLVCSDSTPEQVDTFVNVFAEFGLSIVFTDELQRLRANPQGEAMNRATEPATAPEPVQSKWAGWDQSNLPWSEAKHKDAVCYATFGDTWWMDDAAKLIGFIDKTWGGQASEATSPAYVHPLEMAALNRALDFIESLTDKHFMMGMDPGEISVDDVRDHARIELASIKKLLNRSEPTKEPTS